MAALTVPSGHADIKLELCAERVVEGHERFGAAVAGCEFGVFRAVKSGWLIEKCIGLINRGGVAALVPASASDAYLENIVDQVKGYVRSRTVVKGSDPEGILALPTSGSTGIPKLVAIPASGIARFLNWGKEFFGFDASTVSLSLSPWSFDVSLLDSWAVLAARGKVVAADAAKLYEVQYLARLLSAYRPRFVQVVPTTLDALVNATGGEEHTSVRDLVLTGGVSSQASRSAAAHAFPNAAFHNIYGATEVNDCLIQTFTRDEFAEFETLPLGAPIDGCAVYIDDDGSLTQLSGVSADAQGELLVQTPWMALGYISDGRLEPLGGVEIDAMREFYPMKDRVESIDGHLNYIGREDRTLKLRGQRVNLDEIELAATQTGLVGMARAWTAASAEGEELHLAYTSLNHSSSSVSGLELRMQLSRQLPAFAMPNHLHDFGQQLPLNGNGKPDLNAIMTQLQSE